MCVLMVSDSQSTNIKAKDEDVENVIALRRLTSRFKGQLTEHGVALLEDAFMSAGVKPSELGSLIQERDALLKRFTYLSKKRPLTEEEKKELDALPTRINERSDKIADIKSKVYDTLAAMDDANIQLDRLDSFMNPPPKNENTSNDVDDDSDNKEPEE